MHAALETSCRRKLGFQGSDMFLCFLPADLERLTSLQHLYEEKHTTFIFSTGLQKTMLIFGTIKLTDAEVFSVSGQHELVFDENCPVIQVFNDYLTQR